MKPQLKTFAYGLTLAATVLGSTVQAVAEVAYGDVAFRPAADTYLESDGTGVIDIEYVPNAKTRVEADYRIGGDDSGKHSLWGLTYEFSECFNQGWWNGYYAKSQFVLVPKFEAGYYEPRVRYDFKQRYRTTLDAKNGRYIVRSEAGEVLADKTFDLPSADYKATQSMVVFASRNENGNCERQSRSRLYSLAVYEDDRLVRDLIPYGAGAVTGLLDRCTGKVYAHMQPDQKPFTIGTDAPSVTFDRSRNQFFDTGVYVTPKTKIDVEFTLLSTMTTGGSSDRKAIFGAGDGTGLQCFFVTIPTDPEKYNVAGRFVWAVRGSGSSSLQWMDYLDYADCRIVFDLPGDQITLYSGTNVYYTKKVSDIFGVPQGTSSTTLRLGDWIGTWKCPDLKIRSAKIWEDGKLVRDYVPRMVDNVMGLQDFVNNTFITAVETGSTYELGGAGAVPCGSKTSVGEAANLDAYVESHGNNCYVATDYKPNYKSRIEFDAAPLHASNLMRLYGCDFVNQYNHVTKSGYYFEFKPGKTAAAYTTASIAPLRGTVRYQSFIDWPKGEVGFVFGGVTNSWPHAFPTEVEPYEAKYPIHIFGFKDSSGSLLRGCQMRFFGMSIYEDGELVRKFLPCQIDGVAGLWEVCKGSFLTSSVPNGLSFAGAGINGGGMVFSDQPKSCKIKVDGTNTLVAFAPTAVAYQWYKNGEPIPGATEGTLKIAWEKRPRTSVYRCVAFYALAGQSESDEVTVLNKPRGTILFAR